MLVEQGVQIDVVAEAQTITTTLQPCESLAPPPPVERLSPLQTLFQRCRASAQAGQWADVERIASTAAATFGHEAFFHTQWAWAVHRQGRTVEALHIVEKVAHRFPQSVAVAYTLACLNGSLERLTAAREWLSAAIQRASNPGKVKLRSLVQSELQALWSEERDARS